MITSSVEDAHTPLLIVHRKVALVPTARPVTVVEEEDGEVIVAEPETRDQLPVPTVGVLAAMVKSANPQVTWSGPALAVVGSSSFCRVTSSIEEGQTPLVIVHLSVTFDPVATPVTVVVGEEGEVIVADPETSDHVPLPNTGVGKLAPRVKVEVLQST